MNPIKSDSYSNNVNNASTLMNIHLSNFIKDISDKFPNFSKLDTKSQFIWLMSSEDKILIQKVPFLLHNLNEERNGILNK